MITLRPSDADSGSAWEAEGAVAVHRAARDLAQKLKDLASEELEAAIADLEVAGGKVRVARTDRAIPFAKLAALPRATEAMLTGKGEFVPPDAIIRTPRISPKSRSTPKPASPASRAIPCAMTSA